MRTVIAIARELFGLFVEDGSLALSVLALIAFAAVVLWAVPDRPLVGGGVLLFGYLAALFINVAKSARK
jgi:hypothetical protein